MDLSFLTLPLILPPELVDEVLQHWIAPEFLTVEEESSASYNISEQSSAYASAPQPSAPDTLRVAYACATDSAVDSLRTLPMELREQYWRARHLSYLKAAKVFNHPYDFYMSHYILSTDPTSKLPPFDPSLDSLIQTCNNVTIQPLLVLPHAHIDLHGLERVELDFDALQYFAFFNVRIPPFDISDDRHHDPYIHGAALLLQHCQHLVLHFNDAYTWAHPWLDVKDSAWAEARHRPKVCGSGIIVDWILEYAWHGKFLQHLDRFEMRGDVQEWVKSKWAAIFEQHRSRRGHGASDPFAVHKPDMNAIERYGMTGNEWRPEEHFPPRCECAIGCWSLMGGEVLEDIEECVWDEVDDTRGDWDEVVY